VHLALPSSFFKPEPRPPGFKLDVHIATSPVHARKKTEEDETPANIKTEGVETETDALKEKITAKEEELTLMHIKTAELKAELDILTARCRD